MNLTPDSGTPPDNDSHGSGKPKDRGKPLIPILAVIGFAAIFIGEKTDIALLTTAGFICVGAASLYLGIEVMCTRRIVLPSRYDRRANETYLGIAAIAQGVQLVLIGLFFASAAILFHLNLATPLFRLLVRRPGALLLLFGLFCLTAALTAAVGYLEQRETTRFVYILDLLTTRLLAGTIITIIGLAAIGLGCVEVFAPEVFDSWGGGYLELLFGAR
jgi:hypothetical protein